MSSNTTATPAHSQDVVFVVGYALVFTAGLTLNIIALVTFFKNAKNRSHTTIYMIHLALADLLLLCTLPVRISYHAGFPGFPPTVCKFSGVVLLSNMYGSIFLLTCISVDRCVAVCFPLSSGVREGRKKACWICLGVWFFTIGTGLPIYFRDTNSTSVMETKCFWNFPRTSIQPIALLSTLIIGFGIPFVVMVVSSWGLIQAIGKSTAVQTSNLVDSGRIRRMIATNLIIFLVCFLPYHLMLILLYFYEETGGSLLAYQYGLMFACLNATLDPIAYYFTTETFRRKPNVETVRKKWHMNSRSS